MGEREEGDWPPVPSPAMREENLAANYDEREREREKERKKRGS